MHVMPHIKTGLLATRSGTIMAGALSFQVEWMDSVSLALSARHTQDESPILPALSVPPSQFRIAPKSLGAPCLLVVSPVRPLQISIQGRGGHAALPHLNVDPIVAAAGLISALQVDSEPSNLGKCGMQT